MMDYLRTYLDQYSFLAGGDNRGPLASLGVGYQLPLLDGRFTLEAEAGLRRSTSHALVEGLGTVDSRVLASPLLFSVRGRAFELGRAATALTQRHPTD